MPPARKTGAFGTAFEKQFLDFIASNKKDCESSRHGRAFDQPVDFLTDNYGRLV